MMKTIKIGKNTNVIPLNESERFYVEEYHTGRLDFVGTKEEAREWYKENKWNLVTFNELTRTFYVE